MPDIEICTIIDDNFSSVANRLPTEIDSSYIDDKAINYLKRYISSSCTRVDIEFPYFDWEYLSSVYSYYIKATKPAKRECYRLHFYIGNVYCGYIILRPTPHTHIGRIQASPNLFLDDFSNKAYIITSPYSSNILGTVKSVNCFQFITQDPEVAMCAQVATWAIVERAAKLGRNVIRRKIAEITEAAWSFPERKIPAKGLTPRNILEVLTSVGLYPIIVGSVDNALCHNEIFAYIESGIPVIGLYTSENHAICLIGHGNVIQYNEDELNALFKYSSEPVPEKVSTRILMCHKFVDGMIVNDDGYAPYMRMSCQLEVAGAEEEYVAYTLENIESFIVPLSEKIYISYQEVYETALSYIYAYEKDFSNRMVMRIYLTTSASYKSYALRSIASRSLADTICRMNMSSNIWCVELATPENYYRGMVDYLLVYDSTRHSKDIQPWSLIQSRSKIIHYDGYEFITITATVQPYKQYRSNLEEI